MTRLKTTRTLLALSATALAVLVAACTASNTDSAAAGAAAQQNDMVAQHLATFDTLDYVVFSNQTWDRLGESHADDIIVTWPDGHDTRGLTQHIEDLKAMFVYAPDTKIAVHPIRFGAGKWTCVTGVMTGTFSRPMPIGEGKTIPPTGKSFSLTMATIGRWKDGRMIEESLFWDNQAFMRQIGLAQ